MSQSLLDSALAWVKERPALVITGAVGVGALVGTLTAKRALHRKAVLSYANSSSKKVLLISNSKLFGLEYLEHCADHICTFLGKELPSYVLFVPYALKDRDGYAAKAQKAFKDLGYEMRSIHEFAPRSRAQAVRGASAIFVGGGNTYRLLNCLYADGVIPLIKQRVEEGALKYIGSSAGTNVACPTIRNTNDMPIVQPPSFAGICLVPFQINTHYIDKEREVKHHMGETRETRITEFHEENSIPVLALREGSAVLVTGCKAVLLGPAKRSPEVTWEGARLFRPGKQEEISPGPGGDLTHLMSLDPVKQYDISSAVVATPVSLKSG